MRVCIVGDFSPQRDEGFKNICHTLAEQLAERIEVVRLNQRDARTRAFWHTLAGGRPDIVHVISQPTNAAFVMGRLARLFHRRARVVVSALKSETYFTRADGRATALQGAAIRAGAPDLVLVQEARAGSAFERLGCQVAQLPNGVDLERFRPASAEQRVTLRARYGLDPDRPVVLHVGHLSRARNLTALAGLPRRGIQVLVAGSRYLVERGQEPGARSDDIAERLRRSGCVILDGYQPQVEELYALSDCYVFPLAPGNSITMPLSVLEAMATNLPVVTTRFPGLVDAFPAGGGLHYIDTDEEIADAVQRALDARAEVRTRELVQPYSWAAVGERLVHCYEGLVAG